MVGLRGALVAVLCVGLLAGCQDDPKPKVADPTTPAPSTSGLPTTSVPTTTSTPTPTGPVEPPEAALNSDSGAKAFVTYYIDVFNFAEASGDTTLLASLATDHCAACSGYVRAINKAYDGGGRIEGGQLTLGELRDLPAAFGADKGVYALGRSTRQTVFGADGTAIDDNPSSTFRLFAYPKWSGDAWLMHWMRTP